MKMVLREQLHIRDLKLKAVKSKKRFALACCKSKLIVLLSCVVCSNCYNIISVKEI